MFGRCLVNVRGLVVVAGLPTLRNPFVVMAREKRGLYVRKMGRHHQFEVDMVMSYLHTSITYCVCASPVLCGTLNVEL